MSQSDVEILTQDGITIIRLGEQYDNLDEPALEAASLDILEAAKLADPPYIVFDMTETKFFGSAFLGILFRVWRRLTARKGKLSMCGATGPCAEVLEVTQVDRLWDLYETRDEAIASLKS